MTNELTEDERFGLLMLLDKRLNDKKDGALTEAKAAARDELLGLHAEHGVDRRAFMSAGGEKLGEASISFSKPKPSIKGELMSEALEYLEGLDLVDVVPKRGWEDHFALVGDSVLCKDTGEFVDWAFWVDGYAKSVSVRGFKPDDVLRALAPKIGTASPFALLEDGV